MKAKKIPMRMCLGCREMKPKKELLRIVHGPDGSVTADATGKKPGRGAYICISEECLVSFCLPDADGSLGNHTLL